MTATYVPPRRRTSSEGTSFRPSRQAQPTEGRIETSSRLVSVRSVVSSRSGVLSAALATLLTRVLAATGPNMGWADRELSSLETRLAQLEELEAQVWDLAAHAEGESARRYRMEKWQEWHAMQIARIRRIKEASWALQQASAVRAEDRDGRCGRSAGHVEKVRLPTFSGRHEEFAEFRRQFQELCRGEKYTPVLEMAQLRLKIPKEAVHALGGLQEPDDAWSRLEEMYGNRELSIMSALKSVRDFKSSKSSAHEKIIDLVVTVQRARTILESLNAAQELTGDRETLASIVLALPSDAQAKWYDREVPDDETTEQKGTFLLSWLERQRKNAVRLHLDTIATKMRTSSPVRHKAAGVGESTDKGLMSSSLHAMDSGSRRVGEGQAQDEASKWTQPCRRLGGNRSWSHRGTIATRRNCCRGKETGQPGRQEDGQMSGVLTSTHVRTDVDHGTTPCKGVPALDAPHYLRQVHGT